MLIISFSDKSRIANALNQILFNILLFKYNFSYQLRFGKSTSLEQVIRFANDEINFMSRNKTVIRIYLKIKKISKHGNNLLLEIFKLKQLNLIKNETIVFLQKNKEMAEKNISSN